MKNITLSMGSSSLFANPKVTVEINNDFTIYAKMQVIVACDKHDNWCWDDIEVVDIDEISYMGMTVSGYDATKAFVDHHKSMGIDLWDLVNEAGMGIIKSYSPNEFVSRFTDFNCK